MSDAQLDGVPQDAQPLDESAAEGDYDAMSPEEERLIELVGYLVQGIVGHPEEVEVEEFLDDAGTVYGVRVHPEDIGRVIGKDGSLTGYGGGLWRKRLLLELERNGRLPG